MEHHIEIEFVDFKVIKAWQFSKFNVRRDYIFEVETLISTHQVKEMRGATSHDPIRSQILFYNTASVFSRLLVERVFPCCFKTLMGTH